MNPNANKGPRACTTCAKAKSRCIPGPTEDKCERCHRLNKPCGIQTPAPPRRRKEPRVTKVQALERRLEDLTARLEATKEKAPISSNFSPNCFRFTHLFPDESANSNLSPPSAETVPSETLVSTPSAPSLSVPSVVCHDTEPLSQTGSSPSSPPTPTSPAAMLPRLNSSHDPMSPWPSGALAERWLSDFRAYSAPLFPFVIIPPGSSAEVQRNGPFVWKAAVTHSSGHGDYGDGNKQIHLCSEMMKEVLTEAFVMARKSMDVLRGLELMVAWFHYSLNTFQVTNLLFLARGMAAGLGLAEKATEAEKMMDMGKVADIKSEDLEGMRALCGAYYLITVVFAANKKLDHLMCPRPVESACRVLESRMERPSDELLVYMVRIQILAQSIITTLADNSQVPLALIAKPFQDQLDAFRASIPQSLKNHQTLNSHIATATILLYESSLSPSPSPQSLPHTSSSAQSRVKHLYLVLQAAKSYVTVRFAPSPLSRYYDAPPALAPHPLRESGSCDAHGRPKFICMSGFDFMYVFITCLKLVLLTSVPGWDVGIVKRELMLEPLIERQVRDLDRLAARRIRPGTKEYTGIAGVYGGSIGVEGEDEDGQGRRGKGEPRVADPFHKLGMKLREFKALFRVEEDDCDPAPTTAHPQLHSAISQQGRMVMGAPQQPQPNVNFEQLGVMPMDWQDTPDAAAELEIQTGMGGLDGGMHMSMDLNEVADGFDPIYWHDLFSEDALRFYHTSDFSTEGVMMMSMPGLE